MKDLDRILQFLNADKADIRTMKHLGAFSGATYDEVVEIYNYCHSKGIELNNPNTWVVFGASFAQVKNTVENYEVKGEIAALREKPERINSKGALDRIEFMKLNGEPYENEGKYANLMFSKRRFDSKYPSGLNIAQEPIKPIVEPLVSTPPLNVSPAPIMQPNENIINPVASEVIIAPVESEHVVSPVVEEVVAKTEPIVDEPTYDNYCEQILAAAAMPIANDKIDLYMEAIEDIRQVLANVYDEPQKQEISDEMIFKLQKLVAAGVDDTHDLLFYPIAHNKNLPEALYNRVEEKINERIQDKEYGRRAA